MAGKTWVHVGNGLPRAVCGAVCDNPREDRSRLMRATPGGLRPRIPCATESTGVTTCVRLMSTIQLSDVLKLLETCGLIHSLLFDGTVAGADINQASLHTMKMKRRRLGWASGRGLPRPYISWL